MSNGGIVLSKPLSLPEGTKVRIQIEPISNHIHAKNFTHPVNRSVGPIFYKLKKDC